MSKCQTSMGSESGMNMLSARGVPAAHAIHSIIEHVSSPRDPPEGLFGSQRTNNTSMSSTCIVQHKVAGHATLGMLTIICSHLKDHHHWVMILHLLVK